MATSNRDVTLKLSVETLGEDGIKELQKAVEALGRDGGAAAPEFQKLADEIGRLGEQSQALSTFRALSEETDKLAARQAEAATSAAQMAERLEVLRDATAKATQRQSEANTELLKGQRTQAEATAALRLLKAEYDAAGKNTAAYRDKLADAVKTQNAANVELVTLRANQKAANAEVSEAAAAQGKLETQYKKSAAQVGRLDDELRKQNEALRQATTAAEALGLSTADVAAAEGKLLATLQAGVATVNQRTTAIKEMTDADRLLAIEEKAVADLLARGQAALQAETLAQRDAARATEQYAATKREAAAANDAWQKEAEALVNAAHAAQQLARETEILAAAQRELANQNAFEKQATEAQKLLQAAQYVKFWENALEQAETQVKQTADEAQKAAQRIDNAFGTLGVRSVQAVQQEIAETRAAMATLATTAGQTGSQLSGAFAAGENKIKVLEREIRELTGTLTTADKAAGLFKNSLGQIAAGNLIADAVGSIVEKVKDMGRQFIASVVQLDTFRRAMNAVYKDTALVASQLDFLRKTANDSGVGVGGLSDSFIKFSASMKSANVPVQQSNELFASLTRAAGSLGLGAERTSLALDALGQIASKGVVSMEELRQQLGDSLPGALSLTAKGLGITDAELVKLVESGNLAARDFFPAFTRGLKELHGETEGLIPTWERLKNAFTLTAQTAGDAGGLEIMVAALRALGLVLGAILVPMISVIDRITTLIRVGGTLAAAVVTWTNPLEALNKLWSDMAERQNKLVTAFGNVVFGANQSRAALADMATVTAAASEAAKTAGVAWDGMSRSQQASAVAAVIASDAHKDLSSKLVSVTASTEGFLVAQAAETDSLTKLAKAAKEYGDSMVAIARLRGDETEILKVIAQSTFDLAVALDKASASRAEEVRLLELELVVLERTRRLQGDNTEEIKKQTQALEKKITLAKAEAAQAEASAESARKEAVARQLSAEAYADNSAKVAEYGAQLARANEILKITEQLEKAGAVGKKELQAATEAVAVAQARYADAVRDSQNNLRLENETRRANLLIAKESLASEVALLQAKAQQARNSGLLVTALSLEREAKQKQLAIERLLLDIKEIELQLLREELKGKAAMLALQEPDNELKRKELELRIKLTEIQEKQIASGRALLGIKEKELSSSSTLAGAFDREASARGNVTEASERQADAMAKMLMQYTLSADYSERQIAILEREAAAEEKLAEARRKRLNVDKEGYSLNTAGERVMAGETQEQVDRDIARRYGEENIGNPDAIKARGLAEMLKFISSQGGQIRDPNYSKQVADMRRQLQELEAKLLNTGPAPGGTATTPTGGGSTPTGGSPSGGRPSGGGLSAGGNLTVNIGGRPIGTITGLNPTQSRETLAVLRALETSQGTAA